MARPRPKNEEIKLDPKKIIVSKTDASGIITYANDYFVEVCQYSQEELLGSPHNIVRHPDMPKVAFKLMWDTINKGENFKAVVKNLAKDGRYYWVITDFEPYYDPATGKIIEHTAYRMPAPRKAIEAMEPIYAKLLEIEQIKGMEGSLEYLKGFLAANNTTYDEFVQKLYESAGLWTKIYQALKKVFGR
ncbi:MAG: PAS domain-containing protein [Campylobacter sp.]|nr:PAS domain-containing protein [Campylobacter sp.]